MTSSSDIRGIIFDFDGLILETESVVWQCWNDVYQQHGHELPQSQWIDCMGRAPGYRDFHATLEQLTGKSLDRQALNEKRYQQTMQILTHQPPLPGVVDWLDSARALGLKVAAASGSGGTWVVDHLSRMGLIDRFETIVTSADTDKHKPDPEPFLCAAGRLGVEPAACIVLEDAIHGVSAGRAAGMYTIAVPSVLTRGLDFSHADLVLDSLAALTLGDLLDRLAPQWDDPIATCIANCCNQIRACRATHWSGKNGLLNS